MNTNWIGIDDHADSLFVAVYRGNEAAPSVEKKLENTEQGRKELVRMCKGLAGKARCVYEAGPCGFELYRYLRKHKVDCEVAAPSLTPRKPGERVKTNRRDAKKLARSYRSGELTLITVPTPDREAAREVTRARDAARKDVLRKRHQLSKFLLRQGRRYRQGRAWTQRHWEWLRAQTFDNEHLVVVFGELTAAVEHASELLLRWDKRVADIAGSAEYAPFVNALRVLRGVDTLSALTFLLELGDLRRFRTAPALMAALGLVPSESSTGNHQHRFHITKTGNARARFIAVEAAWSYTRRPVVSRTVLRRRKDQPPEIVQIARKADLRIHAKYHRLVRRGKLPAVAVTAAARELVGFIWAIAQQLPGIPN